MEDDDELLQSLSVSANDSKEEGGARVTTTEEENLAAYEE